MFKIVSWHVVGVHTKCSSQTFLFHLHIAPLRIEVLCQGLDSHPLNRNQPLQKIDSDRR